MHKRGVPVAAAAAAAVLFSVAAATLAGQATGAKPRLSEAIRQAIEKGGAEAARRRFSEIYPAQRDKYDIDSGALFELGSEYIKRGDMATGQVVMEMMMAVAQAEAGGDPGAMSRPLPGDPAPREGTDESRARASAADIGASRTDLARFRGVYGDPKAQKYPRNVFVIETCDGHLEFGAMWGDVAPWTMKPVSDTEFVQARLSSFETTPIRLKFEVDADGKARALAHSLRKEEGAVPRLGDLPATFDTRKCPDRR